MLLDYIIKITCRWKYHGLRYIWLWVNCQILWSRIKVTVPKTNNDATILLVISHTDNKTQIALLKRMLSREKNQLCNFNYFSDFVSILRVKNTTPVSRNPSLICIIFQGENHRVMVFIVPSKLSKRCMYNWTEVCGD